MIFETYINKMLQKLANIICIIYLNDILIFNEDSTNHQRYMQQILEHSKNFELYINLKKCEFDIQEIKFLNFMISTKRV